ncbi:MAG: NfeD family protein [Tepidimonas sp.]|uniref:NfeD family protein n=1 Tax=Tepidimonas sp. TaxID=2002775 RepID=UPI00405531C3
MADSTLWWVLTGVAVVAELLSGTFFLLMLAVGGAAGAIAAHAVQITAWGADGTARVRYRGADWLAETVPGAACVPGTWRITAVVGSRLIVEPV